MKKLLAGLVLLLVFGIADTGDSWSALGRVNVANTVTVSGTIAAVTSLTNGVTVNNAALVVKSQVVATTTHTNASAVTASSVALAANADRVGAIIQNDSDIVVYLAVGATATENAGIRLNASGGSWVMAESNLSTAVINVIGANAGASKVVLVTEFAK